MRTSLASYLDDFLARGDQTAFAHKQGLRLDCWSYSQTARTAAQFARELEQRNIAKGDRILLWAGNSPQWVASFFGCLLRGVIAVPLDLQSERGFVKRVQAQVNAKLALCDRTNADLVPPTLPVMILDELTTQLEHHSSQPYPLTQCKDDSIVEIVFTSGTTAEPKGVVITNRNLMANLTPLELEIRRYLKWERLVHPIRFLDLLPLSHVFGQFMGIFVPQLLRGEVFFQASLRPSQIMETIKRERISVVITVPRILDALQEKIEGDDKSDRLGTALATADNRHFLRRWWTFRAIHRRFGWKFWAFILGGAALNPDSEQFWQRLGFAVIQGYGMTETASLVSVNHPFKMARGSIGRVMPGQEVKLAENGEILIRGENVSPGYWQEGEQPIATNDGWLRTGDVGEIGDEGSLYFKGRRKEVIVTSAGVNIYPADLEVVLEREPEIKACVVIENESSRGPEPLAVLILRDPQAKVETVISRVNRSLAPYQQLQRWFIWRAEDFPRTPTQKIKKQAVQAVVHSELVGEARNSDNSTVEHSNELMEIISRISKEGSTGLGPTARLGTDVKLDSLGRVELLSALEDRYQLEIDEAAFTDATTIAEVEKIVRDGRLEDGVPYPYPRWQQRWPLSWLRLVLLYVIVLPFTYVMGRPTIKGKQYLRELRGPLVFICNHVTMTDHALILLALPGRFRRKMAIAMDGELLKEWRHPPTGTPALTRLRYLIEFVTVVCFFNVFSMPQKSGFRRSFSFAGELVDNGFSLLVFPEGKRTENGQINPFMAGTGLLIQKLRAPVVPIRVDGLWELKQAGRHFARRGEVSVTFGAVRSYSQGYNPEAIVTDLSEEVSRL